MPDAGRGSPACSSARSSASGAMIGTARSLPVLVRFSRPSLAVGRADDEASLLDVLPAQGAHLGGPQAGVGHEAGHGAVAGEAHLGADQLHLERLRGPAALDRAIEAPEPAAGVVADQVVAERDPERRGEDLHGPVGRVGGGALAHQGGAPGADLGAGDLGEAQAPQVRHDQLVDAVGPLAACDRLPGDALGAEPVLEPVGEDEAPLVGRAAPRAQGRRRRSAPRAWWRSGACAGGGARSSRRARACGAALAHGSATARRRSYPDLRQLVRHF